MTEAFLQYLWQHGLFCASDLRTTENVPLFVVSPGYLNGDAGADFRQAVVMIGNMKWVGDVEIHIRSSDWYRHGHHHDDKYKSVILHVVYQHDCEVERQDGEFFPVLELAPYISEEMHRHYSSLVSSQALLPCRAYLQQVKPIYVQSMLSSMLMERLLRKQQAIVRMLSECEHNWREVFYRMLSAGFGFKTNTAAFELLAVSLPFHILAKHSDSELQTRALLFGQAGFLESPGADDYYNAMKYEYDYLRCKYRLTPIGSFHWNLLRLRPSNFPCIRLSQLSALLYRAPDLMNELMENADASSWRKMFEVKADSYWQHHYHFGKKTILRHSVMLGESAVSSLLINAVVPFLFSYCKFSGEERMMENIMLQLEQIPFEDNRVTRVFVDTPFSQKSAFDSQALTELKSTRCDKRECLKCTIGEQIVRKRPDLPQEQP